MTSFKHDLSFTSRIQMQRSVIQHGEEKTTLCWWCKENRFKADYFNLNSFSTKILAQIFTITMSYSTCWKYLALRLRIQQNLRFFLHHVIRWSAHVWAWAWSSGSLTINEALASVQWGRSIPACLLLFLPFSSATLSLLFSHAVKPSPRLSLTSLLWSNSLPVYYSSLYCLPFLLKHIFSVTLILDCTFSPSPSPPDVHQGASFKVCHLLNPPPVSWLQVLPSHTSSVQLHACHRIGLMAKLQWDWVIQFM